MAKSAESNHALVGAPAPTFSLPAQSGGQQAAIDQAPSKVVIVDFWATWCGPCRKSFPHYQELAERYRRDLWIVGVSVDDEPGGIADFAKQTGAGFVLAWDHNKSVAGSYEPPAMPTSFVIDKNGLVRFVHAGYRPGDEKQIETEIQQLIAE
jgi:peroxiredoxin